MKNKNLARVSKKDNSALMQKQTELPAEKLVSIDATLDRVTLTFREKSGTERSEVRDPIEFSRAMFADIKMPRYAGSPFVA